MDGPFVARHERTLMDPLTALKKHRKFPFSGYREDEEQFLMSQVYWLELFKPLARQTQDPWEGWMSPLPDRDGSMMFSAVCPARSKGIIINQYAPTEDDVPLAQGGSYHPFVAWMGEFGDGAQEPAIEHLTLNSEISDWCEPYCLRLLKMYVVEKRSRRDMEEEISRLEDELYGSVKPAP